MPHKDRDQQRKWAAAWYHRNAAKVLETRKARRKALSEDRKEELRNIDNTRRRVDGERKRADGECLKCQLPRQEHSAYCIKHWAIHCSDNSGVRKHWREMLDKFDSQDGKCAITGKPMTPGVNASIDHILPKSKFPHIAKDLNNLQWVDLYVNRAKQDLSMEEFLDLCRAVLKGVG